MNVILFDDAAIRLNLLPFTFTRPVSKIRVGILTIAEKWERALNAGASYLTQDYLSKKYPLTQAADNLMLNAAVCPDPSLLAEVTRLQHGEGLKKDDRVLAFRSAQPSLPTVSSIRFLPYTPDVTVIDQPWKIFQHNSAELKRDFQLLTTGRKSEPVSDIHTKVYNQSNIFLESGVHIRAAVLNAEDGPIYLGKNSVVQEGALIKGPFALGEGSHVNMGAKIRGDSTIGPYCKVGGEISNSVIFGYSNKAHDGFLGNSVIGEWCNLGADTNTSNLKNNYENVKLWSYAKGGFANTGLQFCGLMMGDHSKCGINTMFNTGTVVGVSANIFGDGFPRNFIPSFAWGGASGFTTFQLAKAFETAEKVMARRGKELNELEKSILQTIFNETAVNRIWEKK
jgi:UDP-N-acetylglucosamine diphosphorylase/glucosamine-1-phosphate N-acetyltransferase